MELKTVKLTEMNGDLAALREVSARMTEEGGGLRRRS
jgi:hypothetical protein